jgi:hypothetical protein
MRSLFVALYCTLGSYLPDTLHKGGAAAITCLPGPRAKASFRPFPPVFAGGLHSSLCKKITIDYYYRYLIAD